MGLRPRRGHHATVQLHISYKYKWNFSSNECFLFTIRLSIEKKEKNSTLVRKSRVMIPQCKRVYFVFFYIFYNNEYRVGVLELIVFKIN